MRKLPLAVAALLACAASPALAQSGSGTPQAEPPPAAEVAPNPPSPPKPEAIPAAPKAPAARITLRLAVIRSIASMMVFCAWISQTGQVAYCSPQPVGWACQTVPKIARRWRKRSRVCRTRSPA